MNHSYIPPSLIGSAIGQLPPGSNRSRARQGASIQAHYTSTSPYTPHPGHHHYSYPLNRPETTTQTVSPSTLRSSGDYGLPSSRLDPSVWLPPSGATARYTTQLAGALSPTRRGASAFDMVPIIKARIEAKLGEVGTLEPPQISQVTDHAVDGLSREGAMLSVRPGRAYILTCLCISTAQWLQLLSSL
ncbi:hypothetical protein TREMEDRAFT_66379 [Tremella mesenterica DSM 1558]|uniref:uncharacterized protein n=1 Tax=Tremella mesenterica (strain ATCC 24925 / CBS 8224 / DSM 1558 / NBRC 9311 / NRRL Y-6157 / RJB 2259-6 / UBC 559-6) TaxID=578456 RepID=UPI00032CBB58|nr:uncharacterized protein TREMEDRAFT_66379 [Tremella mesenterica DSM 1558]EIW65653.1 hypothetical protein TREMEDRAFT_66379 [Tremella mesenterica DSM 1558]